jgi:hypothetical protein
VEWRHELRRQIFLFSTSLLFDSNICKVAWKQRIRSDSRFIATVTNIGFSEGRVWCFVVVTFV